MTAEQAAAPKSWRGRYYEDFDVGDVFRSRFGRTLTETENIWFTCLTLNTNQVHFNVPFAERTRFGQPLVNSTFTLAVVTGMTVPDTSENAAANLARRFATCFTDNDLDGLVALLTDDAWLAMPPAPHEYHGPTAIRAFLTRSGGWRGARRMQLSATRANGQPAFGCYLEGHEPPFTGVIVLTMRGERICGITRFLDSSLAAAFRMDPQVRSH
jgi:hypothetical protein